MPCGQDAWQRQRKAQLCRFPWELGKLVELGPPSPGDIRRGWGEAGLPNCLLPGGHVVCSPLTGRHPQSLIQAAGIFPAAQRSSVLFPSSLYTCTCVCVCVGGNVRECACVLLYTWRPEDNLRGHPQECQSLLGDRVSHQLVPAGWLNCPAGLDWILLSLPPWHWDHKLSPACQLFTWALGTELKSSQLQLTK